MFRCFLWKFCNVYWIFIVLRRWVTFLFHIFLIPKQSFVYQLFTMYQVVIYLFLNRQLDHFSRPEPELHQQASSSSQKYSKIGHKKQFQLIWILN